MVKTDESREFNNTKEGEMGGNYNDGNAQATNKREKQWNEHFGLEMELGQESPKSPAYSANFQNGAKTDRKGTIDDSVHYE